MRWTRTCHGAPPASAVPMCTPGIGDHSLSAVPSSTSLRNTPSRTRRTPLAGSVTASIESVAPSPYIVKSPLKPNRLEYANFWYLASACSTNDQPGGCAKSPTTWPSSCPRTMPGVRNEIVDRPVGRSLLHCPERMVVGCGEHGERLHAPVRRAGRVVRLGHAAVVVAVTDRQHAVAVADRSFAPPPQVPERETANLGPVEGVDVGQRQRAPEAALRHAVGEAASERQRAAVGGEPVTELAGKPRARSTYRAAAARSPSPDAASTRPYVWNANGT